MKHMNLAKKIARRLLPDGLYDIFRIYHNCEVAGYAVYAECVHKYGHNVRILGTAWRGSGDYLFCGMYLGKWLKNNGVENYVFFMPETGSERKIADLYGQGVFNEKHRWYVKSNVRNIRALSTFLQWQTPLYEHFHHGNKNPNNISESCSVPGLCGYKGWNMLDFYLHSGFRLPRDTMPEQPQFIDAGAEEIHAIFVDNGLVPGKTVLLSPYSTGLKKFELPVRFWEELAVWLMEHGWTVATNCAGSEKPVKSTVPLALQYGYIVPFLNNLTQTGGQNVFIGIRSGLCDLVAFAQCRKIIVHTYKSRYWLDGRSIAYTGLNNMGLCDDAVELEYSLHMEKSCLEEIERNVQEPSLGKH